MLSSSSTKFHSWVSINRFQAISEIVKISLALFTSWLEPQQKMLLLKVRDSSRILTNSKQDSVWVGGARFWNKIRTNDPNFAAFSSFFNLDAKYTTWIQEIFKIQKEIGRRTKLSSDLNIWLIYCKCYRYQIVTNISIKTKVMEFQNHLDTIF